MKSEEYIQSKLNELKENITPKQISNKDDLKAEIFRLVMSKKFRKYSVSPDHQEHIKQAIKVNIKNNKPIKLTFPFGGYKLWRLSETPEADWAELFTLIYFSNWLKPICEIYKPGVQCIFYSDDAIVSRLNNIDEANVAPYRQSFQKLIDFMKKYLPKNLQFVYLRVIDQYKDPAEFEKDLSDQIEFFITHPEQLPPFTEKLRSSLELNIQLTEKEKSDPDWQAKNHLIHQSYLALDYKRPFYLAEDNILIFTTPIKNSIAVGMTKHSIAKFWCGIGVLEKDGDDFHQLILTPKQIAESSLKKESISLGLTGKNFKQIKIKQTLI